MSIQPPSISERNEETLGVVVERIANIDENVKRIENNLSKLEGKIDGHYATKSDFKDIERRVSNIEDINKWAIRIILSAIIVAVLAVIGIKQQ
jgi:archaellum component FlaC